MKLFENRVLLVIGVLISSVLIFGGCDSSNSGDDGSPDEIEWNYGSKGPDVWATLSPDFAACGSGSAQSPIDISVDPVDDARLWSFTYGSSGLDMILKDHHIRLNIRSGSSIIVDGVKHNLIYLKFKTPGEHSVQGANGAAEVHFFHQSTDGGITIIAVLVTAGGVNKDLAPLLSRLPVVNDESVVDPTFFVRPIDFIPDDKSFYRYDGSLSEPPCTEGVKWIVLRNTIEFSEGQIEILNKLTGDNNRPIQPLNGRSIVQE